MYIVRSNELILCKNCILPTSSNNLDIQFFNTIGEAFKKAIEVNKKLGTNQFKAYYAPSKNSKNNY